MSFPIFIHDEVDIPMVDFDQCSTLHNVQTIDLVLVNPSHSSFPGGFRTLTSDPASPPLAPLSTSEPC